MPARNAEIVRQLYEGFNRERHGTRELLDPDIEWINPEDAVEPGERHGLGGWDTALGRTQDSFSESRIEVERMAESGDRVATTVTFRVRGRGSGVETEMKQSTCGRSGLGRRCASSGFEIRSAPSRR